MYKVHPETEVTGMGGFSHPKGQPPIKMYERLKGKMNEVVTTGSHMAGGSPVE